MTDYSNIAKWRDETLIVDALGELEEAHLEEVLPAIPALAKHWDWVVRAELAELIGRFYLHDYLGVIKKLLKDRNRHVVAYALMSYYDLLQSKALPVIRKLCTDMDQKVSVRVTALCLAYIETRDPSFIRSLEKIVTRRNCRYYHQYAVLNIFTSFIEPLDDPILLSLLQKIRQKVRDDLGIAKDIDKFFRERNK